MNNFNINTDVFIKEVNNCYLQQNRQSYFFYRLLNWLGFVGSHTNLGKQLYAITLHAAEILKQMPSPQNIPFPIGDPPPVIAKNFDQAMQKLFFEIIPKLEHPPFSETDPIPKIVENYLNPQLKRLRENKDRDSIEEKLERRKERGNLAVQMNYGIKKLKGSSESLMINDLNQKPVGVFKPAEKNLSLLGRITALFKANFGQQAYLHPKVEACAEQAAYFISRSLNFHLTPANRDYTLFEKQGCFQIFLDKEKKLSITEQVKEAELNIPRYQEAKFHLSKLEARSEFDEEELTLFQKFAIFDYLIGNLDRHEQNWLIILTKENKLGAIKAIDNTNAFPKKQPAKDSFVVRNQYKWKSLKISKGPFTEETVQFVKQNLNPHKVLQMVSDFEKKFPGFLDNEMKTLFIARWKTVLKNVNALNSPTSLANK